MKKYMLCLCLAFFIISCGNKETLQDKIEIKDNKKSETVLEEKLQQKVASSEEDTNTQKEENTKNSISKKLSYKIEEEDGNKNLYLLKNGEKIKIDSAFDYASIYNIELYEDFLVYDWSSTGGIMKKIFDTSKMEEISKINFGTWDKTKRFIYNCEEGGYGPGYVKIFNFDTKKGRDLFKDFYENNDDAGVLSCVFNQKTLQINFTIDDNGKKKYSYDIKTDTLKELEK